MLAHIVLATLLASSYVAAIKIKVPVLLRAADRNDPAVIRYRISRILVLCGGILVFLPPLLLYGLKSYELPSDVIKQFGLIPGISQSGNFWLDGKNILTTLAAMCLLYMGPIAHYIYAERQNIRNDFFFLFTVLTGFRDHIFAPITEEFVYRGAVVATLEPVVAEKNILKWLPLLFGVAHLHHGFQLFYNDGFSLSHTLLHVLAQLAYTTVFGLLANKIYLATHCNLWTVILMHGICNLLGFPSFEMLSSHPRWFYVYCVLLCVGIYSFWKMVFT